MTDNLRPSWDSWFMTMCFVVSQRSLDKTTKHGCVVVNNDHSILSVGYNSPPRGCIDDAIPQDRPIKYHYMVHAEANAIANAASMGTSLKGSTFYITGPPCCNCFASIINTGAAKIIHGPILHYRKQEEIEAVHFMNARKQIEVVDFSKCGNSLDDVFALMTRTADYINHKLESQS